MHSQLQTELHIKPSSLLLLNKTFRKGISFGCRVEFIMQRISPESACIINISFDLHTLALNVAPGTDYLQAHVHNEINRLYVLQLLIYTRDKRYFPREFAVYFTASGESGLIYNESCLKRDRVRDCCISNSCTNVRCAISFSEILAGLTGPDYQSYDQYWVNYK